MRGGLPTCCPKKGLEKAPAARAFLTDTLAEVMQLPVQDVADSKEQMILRAVCDERILVPVESLQQSSSTAFTRRSVRSLLCWNLSALSWRTLNSVAGCFSTSSRARVKLRLTRSARASDAELQSA